MLYDRAIPTSLCGNSSMSASASLLESLPMRKEPAGMVAVGGRITACPLYILYANPNCAKEEGNPGGRDAPLRLGVSVGPVSGKEEPPCGSRANAFTPTIAVAA